MRLLSKQDFICVKLNTKGSCFDMLVDVCCVALKLHEEDNRPPPPPPPSPSSSSSSSSSSLKSDQKVEKQNDITAVDELMMNNTMASSSPPRRSSKRSRTTKQENTEQIEEEKEEEGDDDGDDDQVKNSNKKQRKKRSSKRKRRPSNFVAPPADPASYPELPGEFRREIEAMGGIDITLIIQKEVTNTDLKPDHNRLLMPFTKIIGDFLKPEEKARLRAQEVIEEVPLMMKSPSPAARMELMNINMRQWDMHKNSGKMSSSNYVLRTSWKKVVKRNRLEKDDVVQIWSFRVQDRLHLVLVVVARANHQLPLMANTNTTSGNNGSSGSSGNDGSGSGSSANTQIVEATPA